MHVENVSITNISEHSLYWALSLDF